MFSVSANSLCECLHKIALMSEVLQAIRCPRLPAVLFMEEGEFHAKFGREFEIPKQLQSSKHPSSVGRLASIYFLGS